MTEEEKSKKIEQILGKCLVDETFRQRLLQDATAVFREQGFDLPEGAQVRAVEDTDTISYLVLPSSRQSGELSNEELGVVVGGMGDGLKYLADGVVRILGEIAKKIDEQLWQKKR